MESRFKFRFTQTGQHAFTAEYEDEEIMAALDEIVLDELTEPGDALLITRIS